MLAPTNTNSINTDRRLNVNADDFILLLFLITTITDPQAKILLNLIKMQRQKNQLDLLLVHRLMS